MTDKKTDTSAEQVSIVLLQPHTHRRVDYAPGEVVTLRKPQAEKLVTEKRARMASDSDRANIEKAGS